MRLWITLCCLLVSCPAVAHAESVKEYIEKLPTGCINWTQGVLTAKGSFMPERPVSQDTVQQGQYLSQAYAQATQNALTALKRLRIDTQRRVSDAMTANPQLNLKVIQMADHAQTAQEVRLPDGAVEVTVRMALLGGFMQMLLPEDVKQVESIKSVNSEDRPAAESDMAASPSMPRDEGIYTGLIVDARGIGAQPAMVPLIVDESGKEAYGSAFVSREYAVQYGVCEYLGSMEDSTGQARVAPKPLVVKGLRILYDRTCDIVISDADAAKLRDASANLSFLKQCRVIIVLDGPS